MVWSWFKVSEILGICYSVLFGIVDFFYWVLGIRRLENLVIKVI